MLDDGQHAGNTDAVGNKVGGVVGANHVLAQATGHEGFQVVEHIGTSCWRVDQLNQRHVARRIKKVNAAKARLDRFGQGLTELGDRQARRVAGHNRVFGNVRGDLVIQVGFPVHALGNGFDDQVALFEQVHMLFVVGRLNQRCVFSHTERRGFELF